MGPSVPVSLPVFSITLFLTVGQEEPSVAQQYDLRFSVVIQQSPWFALMQ
jgi:hypothetical protein